MHIVAVDNEILALEYMVKMLVCISEQNTEVEGFHSCLKALEYIKSNLQLNKCVDYVFTDMNMPNMSGIAFAKMVKECSPDTQVLFVTAYVERTGEKAELSEAGYILKPSNKIQIEKAMLELKQKPPLEELEVSDGYLRIQTFGTFEATASGQAVCFQHKEEKELFAYLINLRCGSVEMDEIVAFLLSLGYKPEESKKAAKNQLKNLCKVLSKAGANKICTPKRNYVQIDWNKIKSDARFFALGDVNTINSYRGNYMSEYSWAQWNLENWIEPIKK